MSRSRRHPHPRWHLLLAPMMVLGVACSMFEPRDAEPPVEPPPPECQFNDALQPEEALRNFEQAFDCASQGTDMLTQTLHPDFIFNAAVVEEQAVQDLVNGWQQLAPPRSGPVNAFIQHMTAVPRSSALMTIAAAAGDDLPAGDGRVFENVTYSLDFLDGQVITSRFAGTADIFLIQDNTGNYVITRWDDSEGPQGLATMGRFWLRGTAGGS